MGFLSNSLLDNRVKSVVTALSIVASQWTVQSEQWEVKK